MSRFDINGHDPARGVYHVALSDGRGAALIPEAAIAAEFGTATVSRSQAEEWIATMAHDIADAIEALLAGQPAKAPFAPIQLAETPS
jgi:hypothetical protein